MKQFLLLCLLLVVGCHNPTEPTDAAFKVPEGWDVRLGDGHTCHAIPFHTIYIAMPRQAIALCRVYWQR